MRYVLFLSIFFLFSCNEESVAPSSVFCDGVWNSTDPTIVLDIAGHEGFNSSQSRSKYITGSWTASSITPGAGTISGSYAFPKVLLRLNGAEVEHTLALAMDSTRLVGLMIIGTDSISVVFARN